VSWDQADHFVVISGDRRVETQANDGLTALEFIVGPDKFAEPTVFVLRDFDALYERDAKMRRKLRTAAQQLRSVRKTIIITSPTAKIPDDLRDEAVLLDVPPPNAEELLLVLDRLAANPQVKSRLTPLGKEKLVQAAVGLSESQAARVFSKAFVTDGVIDDRDIDLVTQDKKQIIRESQALEFYPASETPDDVGGLGVLKDWLRLRERAFTEEARKYGLPAPKGIALIGIPGTGKSLTAKMIGGLWRVPLVRFDVAALFGSLVGQSEERTRQALRLAETVAPCVLWIDEIEKALASGGLDGGTSQRVFGSILTWMSDKTAPCFVVATANDISKLPPELLRKGRFDEVFFLDLPTAREREDIFRVHLRKKNRVVQEFDVQRLARESEGYVGAELEQAIIDAMYVGFNKHQEFTTDDVSTAISQQVPLSRSQREQVRFLRSWLQEGRAKSASFPEVQQAIASFVPLEIAHSEPSA
jgi:SpoVK/Ycf46/Vps4 family AAA+-type ATPase